MRFRKALTQPRLIIVTARNILMPWLPLVSYVPEVGWWFSWNDHMGRTTYLDKGFEKSEQAFMRRFLQPGMTVFDIGAHHGFHTLLMSRRVGTNGYVIAFEPSPREARKLCWTLKVNRRRNVCVEPFAMGSSEGDGQFYLCLGQNSGCNSLRQPAPSEPVQTIISVPVTTLDSYLRRCDINQVDLIKIDAEGAELEVLQGAQGLLQSSARPVFICEMADVRTAPWGYPASKIYDLLKGFGYLWFSATPEGKLNQCPPKKDYNDNLVAVPQERLKYMEMLLAGVSNS